MALRFGNANHHGRSRKKEATNYLAALKLVQSTGNARGVGICHNNLANLAGQDKDVRVGLGLEPQHHFDQAIANAREQPHGSPATLATRLLNCALWHMREGRVEKACECLAWGPAGSCVASCGADAKTLAAIAVTCTRNIGSAQLPPSREAQLLSAVRDVCARAVAEAAAA